MKSAPRETIPTSIVTPLRRRHTGQLETMPFFSWNPQGERFCPLSLMVRTPPFHGGDSGSIPGEDEGGGIFPPRSGPAYPSLDRGKRSLA